jgi:perosamine synthetase
MINIYEPNVAKYTKSAIDAIESGWISNHGKYIELANVKLQNTIGCKYSILMANGTCATHCLFLAVKHKYPHIDKIYVPNNAYVAAWNAALMVYPISHLSTMKMNIDTWNADTSDEYITSLNTNSCVLIVHNLGNIINVPKLKHLRPDLVFVEDNCEGFLGKYNNIYSGTGDCSECASISFYGNKNITTGEGGAFLTNNLDTYEYIKSVYSQGMSEIRYVHNVHAYNYRMTNIQAAFLYDQLFDIVNIINTKKSIFEYYERMMEPLIINGKIKLFKKEDNTESSNWIFAVRLVKNKMSIVDTTEYFKNNNVDVRPFFYPINAHLHLNNLQFNDENPYLLNNEIIMIPSSPNITIEQQLRIINVIFKFIEE